MKYYEFAISEGFGTLTSHSVIALLDDAPEPVKGDLVARQITQAEYEACGPNRVPQYD